LERPRTGALWCRVWPVSYRWISCNYFCTSVTRNDFVIKCSRLLTILTVSYWWWQFVRNNGRFNLNSSFWWLHASMLPVSWEPVFAWYAIHATVSGYLSVLTEQNQVSFSCISFSPCMLWVSLFKSVLAYVQWYVKCIADVGCAEIPEQSTPNRVHKLVARYSELGKSLASPLDDVTSSARSQSPVQEVIGESEENEHEK